MFYFTLKRHFSIKKIVFCHDFGFIDHKTVEPFFLIRLSSFYAVVEKNMSSPGFISTTHIFSLVL